VAPATSGDSFSSATFTIRLIRQHFVKSPMWDFNRFYEKCLWVTWQSLFQALHNLGFIMD
jgi:hypothetical protein